MHTQERELAATQDLTVLTRWKLLCPPAMRCVFKLKLKNRILYAIEIEVSAAHTSASSPMTHSPPHWYWKFDNSHCITSDHSTPPSPSSSDVRLGSVFLVYWFPGFWPLRSRIIKSLINVKCRTIVPRLLICQKGWVVGGGGCWAGIGRALQSWNAGAKYRTWSARNFHN